MPNFTYKARDDSGQLVTGTMAAPTRDELMNKLRAMGYMVSQVTESIAALDMDISFGKFNFEKKVKLQELVAAINQLSNLINAGIPILKSLSMLSMQIRNVTLKKAFKNVSHKVKAGSSLSEAMAMHPKIFSSLLVSIVQSGEISGKLDTILIEHAEYLEQQYEMQQKVKGALFYPVILIGAGCLVTLYLITFVVPQFTVIFVKAGVPLPLPTQILIFVGDAIRKFWYLMMFIPVALVMGFGWATRHEQGKRLWDRFKLKIPIFGELTRKIEVARFSHTLAMLLGSGMALMRSLEMTRQVLMNTVFQDIVEKVKSSVEGGQKMALVLRMSHEFPEDMLQMLEVAEESGSMEAMLEKINKYYEREVDFTLKKLMTLIEPVCLLIIGGMVGMIMASMLLPMLDMMKLLRT